MVEKLYYLLEELTMIICLFGLYGKKVKIDILTMMALIVNMILFSFVQKGYIGQVYPVIALMILFVYSLYEFKQRIKKSLTNMLLCIILVSVLQMICILPMALLTMFIESDAVLLLIVNSVILSAIIMIKDKFSMVSEFVSKSKWDSIFSVVLCVLTIVILLVNYKIHDALKFDMYFIVFVFSGLAISLFQKWLESRKETEIKEHQLRMASIYNDAFDKLTDDIIKRQHDIKNHFNAIFSMHYTYDSYEELVNGQRRYCDDILHIARFDRLLNLNMPILAGFLYSKFHEVEEAGVSIDYKVKLEAKELSVPMYEMITVLGILIDNAKEQAETLEIDNRIVKVNIYEDDKYAYFMFKNISEYIKINDIGVLFEKGHSTKGKNRGIGLNTVKQKSLEYGFDVLVENEKVDANNWIVFGIIIKK